MIIPFSEAGCRSFPRLCIILPSRLSPMKKKIIKEWEEVCENLVLSSGSSLNTNTFIGFSSFFFWLSVIFCFYFSLFSSDSHRTFSFQSSQSCEIPSCDKRYLLHFKNEKVTVFFTIYWLAAYWSQVTNTRCVILIWLLQMLFLSKYIFHLWPFPYGQYSL